MGNKDENEDVFAQLKHFEEELNLLEGDFFGGEEFPTDCMYACAAVSGIG